MKDLYLHVGKLWPRLNIFYPIEFLTKITKLHDLENGNYMLYVN